MVLLENLNFIFHLFIWLKLVESSTVGVMYSKNIVIDQASWIQSNPIIKVNAQWVFSQNKI